MHSRKNDHRHLWLLSGTSEGPWLVKALLKEGWKVSVSVVSANAALAYKDMPIEDLWIGALNGAEEIKGILQKAKSANKAFEWVIDATHPFAVLISADLNNACNEFAQRLIRFDRQIRRPSDAFMIRNLKELSNASLKGKKLLFAIGVRHLSEAVKAARSAGANVFARVLPYPISLQEAFSCDIPEEQLAVLHPFRGISSGELESALCKKWSIDAVVCRQSGGFTQELWEAVCKKQNAELWIIERPVQLLDGEKVATLSELLDRLCI